MKQNTLGKLSRVEIKDIFKDEARDFTPWLAKSENLELLSEEIGIDIKLVEVEARVGRFNVDILAQEDGTDRKIVIENQYDHTDHDHLGKLITYASGHDAKVIIWIFEKIRDEHRQAIEWLNENTHENLDFFAINIQLWQIDNSNPAPKFEIIVQPNEWTKTLRNNSSGQISETKLLQLDFWSRFRDYIATTNSRLKLQKPSPQHWYNFAIGSSEAHISVTVNTNKDEIGCELYITDNKDLFNYLYGMKAQLEIDLGVKLEWIEATKACRIKATRTNSPLEDGEENKSTFAWLLKMVTAFQNQFPGLIKSFGESP